MKNKLMEYRKMKGLSQDELAERLGVSRQTIISIEKGRYNPSLPLALQIGKIFDVAIENIFILEDSDLKSNTKGRV
ncbi:putative transcriptional regulator [Scopulibacillus daqui]|uniref:Transcriptional regulator n=1 Tax=Scopulibacillus daqui TaxID=1469162 RepID=A0ABS2PXK7_9BACL|nr:helix-turn-helix transcriptional regulator [Scopulibacillus daqui]MBM7644440.1 putative transcriptional regulator [Scopulibacillus daqui]